MMHNIARIRQNYKVGTLVLVNEIGLDLIAFNKFKEHSKDGKLIAHA